MKVTDILNHFGMSEDRFNSLSDGLKARLLNVKDDDFMGLHHIGYEIDNLSKVDQEEPKLKVRLIPPENNTEYSWNINKSLPMHERLERERAKDRSIIIEGMARRRVGHLSVKKHNFDQDKCPNCGDDRVRSVASDYGRRREWYLLEYWRAIKQTVVSRRDLNRCPFCGFNL